MMKRLVQLLPGFEVFIRVAADILLVNVSLLLALVLRYIWIITVEDMAILPRELLLFYTQAYLHSFWLLTLLCFAVFSFNGIYSYGRLYHGRYKALVIAQAVSLSYILFGFLAFPFPDLFLLPRSVLFIAWGITLVLLTGARLWSTVWKRVVKIEQRLRPAQPKDRPIQTVLVIGGAGYIGSALLPRLLKQGYNVRLLDLLLFGPEPIAEILNHPRLEIIQADFRQVDKVVEAMRDVDAVIHLGAIVGDPACALDEELTIEINLMATRMIAEVAKGNGVERFIFASTCSVYGASDHMLNEHSTLNPVSLYARSKIASERVLRRMANEHFSPVILRFGTIYGLSGRTRFDLVVNLLSAKALLDGEITVYGGDQWRPFVHVDDAAQAIFTTLRAPLPIVRNEVFNIGSNEQNYTIQQVGEIIHCVVPKAHLVNKGNDSDRRNYRVDFSKLANILGFTPQWTIEQGVRQVVEAIETGKVTSYQHALYSNVKFLNEQGTAHLVRHEHGWAQELISQTAILQETEENCCEDTLAKVLGMPSLESSSHPS
jgi:nucleoside-diphosphate-sugar epimerase